MKWPAKKTIYGCAARGDGQDAYLTRYTLLDTRFGQVCIHVFHPWNFMTVILWRGYVEEIPGGQRRLWPGMIQYRPAEWRHRVQLVHEKPAVTLVFMGRERRDWGFITPQGWQAFRDYFRDKGC